MVILFLSPLLGSKVLANTGGVFILVFLSYTIISTYSLSIKNDERLVRLHIGLEDPKDLIADLKQALKHIK